MNRSFLLEIEKIVYGGRGMGRVNGKVIFVPFTAPGDRVQVEVVRKKRDYAEALLKTIEQESPLRVKPFCALFGRCGGCHYQHLSYAAQLQVKSEVLEDFRVRLPRERDIEILPPIPSPQDRGYRIRAQFKCRKGTLGFYGLKTHQLVEVPQCPLLHPLANRILQGLQKWLGKKSSYAVRGADLQVSPDEGKGVVRLQIEGTSSPQVAEEAKKEIEEVKGAVVEGKKRFSAGELALSYYGPKIFDQGPLPIRADYDSFTQVNPYQNWNLMKQIVEWADLQGKEKVLDLYCGSGNLTLPLAQRALQVWGVDQDRRAIENAAQNALQNSLSNCSFIAASAEVGIKRISKETASVELVVLDPPRAGAKEAIDALALLRPHQILYVSCEPPTLARDLARLAGLGYWIKRIQPLDMFPQTYHIEVIAELIRSF